MTSQPSTGYLRIGELARRAGVSPELLRAWERRYGLLQPERSPGGFRLYSDDDQRRTRRMTEYLAQGLSAAEAARRALTEPARDPVGGAGPAETAVTLRGALEAYDETSAHELLDAALASYGVQAVLDGIVAPTLRALGERWQAGEVTVAQEHFASNILRGRLLGLARGWGQGVGPVAVLACPPGEQHDLPLIMVGLTLRATGWRIAFLGADTPIGTLERAVDALDPRVVVVSSTIPEHLSAAKRDLARLATRIGVYVGGHGLAVDTNGRAGIRRLEADFRQAADDLAAELRR